MTTGQSKSSNELAKEFYEFVGQCVAAWAWVDDELFRIFRRSVGPIDQSAIIYYRTPTLNNRFGLVDEIVVSALPPRGEKSGEHEHESVTAWKTAIKGYNNLLGIRRRIAHHPIKIQTNVLSPGALLGAFYLNHSPLNDGPTIESYFEIYVNHNERLREGSADLKPLRIDDLKTHLHEVSELSARLHRFYDDVLIKHVPEFHSSAPPSKFLKFP